ncbi:MFS transporter [Candidatus Bathyarchaeota archaeon]|nr:MFS transporter [Candidatus Bathyarchaeota archaeon]
MAEERGRLFSFALLAMVATHALIHAAGNMRSTMIVELRNEFVLSNMEIGLISAIPSLASVLFTLPVGWMSDRYGARRLVALSMAMAAAGALIAGFTVDPPLTTTPIMRSPRKPRKRRKHLESSEFFLIRPVAGHPRSLSTAYRQPINDAMNVNTWSNGSSSSRTTPPRPSGSTRSFYARKQSSHSYTHTT